MLFALMIILAAWGSEKSMVCSEGGHPKNKPPDIDALSSFDYATAYYWDMYGALVEMID